MREWCAGQRKTTIGTTEYPVELIWKPTRPPRFEYRPWSPAHGAYPLVVIGGNQPFQPVGSRSSVVVQECEHLSTRELGRGIASRAQAAVVLICQNDQWYRPWRPPFQEVFFALPQQLLVMVDTHDDLDRW